MRIICVCALASDSAESINVTVIKLGTVTASDMVMHHVLIILTLTFAFKVTQILIMNKMFDYFRNKIKGKKLS